MAASLAPYQTRRIRAFRMAPAHMGQGSSVTNSSQSSSRQDPSAALASAMASISAWEAVACFSSLRFRPRPTMVSPRTITQPTGTSPAAAASLASFKASSISRSSRVIIWTTTLSSAALAAVV